MDHDDVPILPSSHLSGVVLDGMMSLEQRIEALEDLVLELATELEAQLGRPYELHGYRGKIFRVARAAALLRRRQVP